MMNTVDELTALMHSTEDLHPDLVPCLRHDTIMPMVSHRFMVGFAVPHGLTNAQYLHTKDAAEVAYDACNWGRYISLHARPFRIDALMDAMEGGLDNDPVEFWKAVGDVWRDSENIYQFLDEWISIWHHDVTDRRSVMDEDDVRAFEHLPDIIPVWRGSNCIQGQSGLSWSTDKAKAKWFAKRFSRGDGYLVQGHVDKNDIMAYFNGRNEKEIVALPDDVRIKKVHVV